MLGRFFEKQKKHGSAAKQRESDRGDQSPFSRLNDLSSEKIKSIIITLNQAEPIFDKAGYCMQQLDVVFGLEPKLTGHFKKIKDVNQADYEALIAQLEENQLIRFILISLHKSERINKLFSDSDLEYYGMTIDIAAQPSVTSIFKKIESRAKIIPIGHPE
ncbi:MAG: hypothetical protein Q9M92_06730 [Enterobacterales bacterium]|nr:hypothetical protein [Enterobacterales bacterium]